MEKWIFITITYLIIGIICFIVLRKETAEMERYESMYFTKHLLIVDIIVAFFPPFTIFTFIMIIINGIRKYGSKRKNSK